MENKTVKVTSGLLHHGVGIGSDNCFYRINKDGEWQVVSLPMVVLKIQKDVFSCELILRLKFLNLAGEVIKIDFPRSELTKTGILALTKYGYPVNSDNANIIIRCIEELELKKGVTVKCYKKLGWYTLGSKLCFLGINKAIGIQAKYMGEWKGNKSKGSYEEWLNLLEEEVFENTPLEIALGIGYASTLIGFLRKIEPSIENFMIHTTGNSSTGKTTAAMLALSLGGNPVVAGNSKSLMLDYSGTEASIISMLQHLNGYPVAIDEASMSKNTTNLIYQLANGRERTRLNPDASLKETGVWESVIFSTGEQSMQSKADNNLGLFVRCINISLDHWTESAIQSNKIKQVVSNNYGFATERFAEYLYNCYINNEIQGILDEYYKNKSAVANALLKRLGENHVIDRLAGKLAVITTAFVCGMESLGYETPDSIVDDMHKLLVEQIPMDTIEGLDLAKKAYEIIVNDVVANYVKYPKSSEQQLNTSIYGTIISTAGKTKNGVKYVRRVSILKEHFEDLLMRHKFRDSNIILKEWREQGLLICKSDRFISAKKISINGVNAPAYEIVIVPEKKDAVRELVKKPKAQMSKKFFDYVEGRMSMEELRNMDDEYWDNEYQCYLQEKESGYIDSMYPFVSERTDGFGGRLKEPRRIKR